MKDQGEIRELLIQYIEQLDEDNVIQLAEKALDEDIEPLRLLEIINEGMSRVGKLYERKDYYIADLIMAGLIFKEVLALNKMTAFFQGNRDRKIGKILLGTVKGDIHDIGKDIFKSMLEASGFQVIDLGVDVPKEYFVKRFMEEKPDIVGLSGALTYTVESMKDVVNAFSEAGIREQVKIIIGAHHLTKEICTYIGANGFANDVSVGIKVCLGWMDEQRGQGVIEHE
ncbi:MAG: cobalamin-dependent protein [Thermotaleaceae bacterium]